MQHSEHPSAGEHSRACSSERAADATPGMELRTSDDDASLLSGASPGTMPDIEVSEDILRHQTLALMDLLDQEPDAHLALLSTVMLAAAMLSCTQTGIKSVTWFTVPADMHGRTGFRGHDSSRHSRDRAVTIRAGHAATTAMEPGRASQCPAGMHHK